MSIERDHLERVQVGVFQTDSMATLSKWVARETFMDGRPYSFEGHEYQERILSDTSIEVNVRKPSQVGVTEATIRLALGMCSVVQPMTTIYTLPTANFAKTVMNTRVQPVIQGSKTLSGLLRPANDNSEVKQLGDSFLYLRGAASSNAPISIPADALIHDEFDFCDPDILSQYASRLTHSRWKLFRRFSTPTLPGIGIDKEFQASRRFFMMCKCNRCGDQFLPSYYDHVKIPGYDGDLRDIRKTSLAKLRWKEAALLCPFCGGTPSLAPDHREWVCENPSEDLVAAGYQVSPFDAPTIVTPSHLIKVSTNYERPQDFVNFGLGLPAEDRQSSIEAQEVKDLMQAGESQGPCVMGIDVGKLYHVVIARVTPQGLRVIHAERVPMGKIRVRYNELRRQFRVVATVIDSAPHGETVMHLQTLDLNLYAAVYVKRKGLSTHDVVEREQSDDRAFVKQVNINRSVSFDAYLEFLRSGELTFDPLGMTNDGEEDTLQSLPKHHTSMKRVRRYDTESGELLFDWQKTDGEDHFHHACLYLFIASKIRGGARPTAQLPLFSAMRMKF